MPEVTLQSPNVSMVSYDLWLTLLNYPDSTFRDQRNELFRELLAPEIPAPEFSSFVHAHDKQADALAETRDADVTFDERVGMLAKALNRPVPGKATLDELYEAQGRLLEQHSPVLIEPQLPAHLERQSAARELAVVSNTGFLHGDQMKGVLERLGIAPYFSRLIFSNEVGKAKPHPDIFGKLTEDGGPASRNILHVGDTRRADYLGALAAGMSAVLIPRNSGVIAAVENIIPEEAVV